MRGVLRDPGRICRHFIRHLNDTPAQRLLIRSDAWFPHVAHGPFWTALSFHSIQD